MVSRMPPTKLEKKMSGTIFRLAFAALLAAPLVASVVGCGKAEYEQSMRNRMEGLAFASKFLQNLQKGETDVLRGVATMQLPAYMEEDVQEFKEGSTDRRGDPIAPSRVQPPFLKIPGFEKSFERHTTMGGRNDTHPVYCYFGSVSAETKQQSLLAQIKAEVGRAFKNRAVWQSVQLDTREPGKKLKLQKMSVTGQQPFEMNPEGGDVRNVDGQFDIYVHSTPDVHVIVAFRATKEADAKLNVFRTAEISLGTLMVESPEEG